jgi:hypothetical protein
VAVGDGVCENEGVVLAVTVGDAEDVGVGVPDGEAGSDSEACGETLGERVGVAGGVGEGVLDADAWGVEVGEAAHKSL